MSECLRPLARLPVWRRVGWQLRLITGLLVSRSVASASFSRMLGLSRLIGGLIAGQAPSDTFNARHDGVTLSLLARLVMLLLVAVRVLLATAPLANRAGLDDGAVRDDLADCTSLAKSLS